MYVFLDTISLSLIPALGSDGVDWVRKLEVPVIVQYDTFASCAKCMCHFFVLAARLFIEK